MRRYRGAAPEPGLSPSNFLGGGGGGGGDKRRESKELREVEVKMAGADGAKIGPLFAF